MVARGTEKRRAVGAIAVVVVAFIALCCLAFPGLAIADDEVAFAGDELACSDDAVAPAAGEDVAQAVEGDAGVDADADVEDIDAEDAAGETAADAFALQAEIGTGEDVAQATISFRCDGSGLVAESETGAGSAGFSTVADEPSTDGVAAWAQPALGYHLEGWTCDLSCDAVVSTSLSLTWKTVGRMALSDGVFSSATFTAVFAPNSYYVAYRENGGTWTACIDDQLMTFDQVANVADGSGCLTREYYHYAGWNTKADGAGKAYADGQAAKNLSTANYGDAAVPYGVASLYAIWQPYVYYVRYAACDDGAFGSMADQEFSYGIAQGLAENLFTRDGYEFAGWATSAGGQKAYDAGAEVLNLSLVDGDVVSLYALWDEVPPMAPDPVEPEPVEPEPIEPDLVPEPDPVEPDLVPESQPIQPVSAAPASPIVDLSGYATIISDVMVVGAVKPAVETVLPVAEKVALVVAPVSKTPIVVGGALGADNLAGYYWGAESAEGGLVEAFANMTSSEKVCVACGVATTLTVVSALAGLLGAGASVAAAAAAGAAGVTGTTGIMGAADLAAELAAESTVSGGLLARLRRRKDVDVDSGAESAGR